MKIKINPYRRRDGALMAYINNDRKVSIGLSADRGFAPYGRDATEGQRKLWEAAIAAVQRLAVAPAAAIDMAVHTEPKADLGRPFGWLAVTDVATVGGVAVGADGAWLILPDGRIFNTGQWIDTDAGTAEFA
jgi:hypothetical protein